MYLLLNETLWLDNFGDLLLNGTENSVRTNVWGVHRARAGIRSGTSLMERLHIQRRWSWAKKHVQGRGASGNVDVQGSWQGVSRGNIDDWKRTTRLDGSLNWRPAVAQIRAIGVTVVAVTSNGRGHKNWENDKLKKCEKLVFNFKSFLNILLEAF